jgi:hypothetical protein
MGHHEELHIFFADVVEFQNKDRVWEGWYARRKA